MRIAAVYLKSSKFKQAGGVARSTGSRARSETDYRWRLNALKYLPKRVEVSAFALGIGIWPLCASVCLGRSLCLPVSARTHVSATCMYVHSERLATRGRASPPTHSERINKTPRARGGSRWRPAALVPSRQRWTRPWTSVPNGPALWAKMRARRRYDCERERAPASQPAQSLRTYWPGCCSGGLCAEEVRFRFHKGT
eukprot:scaffold25689_cov118-Isochrysis_galbana.AAC.2